MLPGFSKPYHPQLCIILNTSILTIEAILVLADVASGADRHLDITYGLQLVESSSIVPYFLEKRLIIPTSLFFI